MKKTIVYTGLFLIIFSCVYFFVVDAPIPSSEWQLQTSFAIGLAAPVMFLFHAVKELFFSRERGNEREKVM